MVRLFHVIKQSKGVVMSVHMIILTIYHSNNRCMYVVMCDGIIPLLWFVLCVCCVCKCCCMNDFPDLSIQQCSIDYCIFHFSMEHSLLLAAVDCCICIIYCSWLFTIALSQGITLNNSLPLCVILSSSIRPEQFNHLHKPVDYCEPFPERHISNYHPSTIGVGIEKILSYLQYSRDLKLRYARENVAM